MQNLTNHYMNSAASVTGGYTGSDMYRFVHNTVLPNLRKSGLNIIACDLVSRDVYDDIVYKTGMSSAAIASTGYFWLSMSSGGNCIWYVDFDGKVNNCASINANFLVRPLITVVKN